MERQWMIDPFFLLYFSIGSIPVYALLVAIGGILGYAKAKSNVSLIAGLGSGVALGSAWFISRTNPAIGVGLAALIALLLLIVFAVRFNKTRAFMPAGLMSILSLLATILYGVTWFASRSLSFPLAP